MTAPFPANLTTLGEFTLEHLVPVVGAVLIIAGMLMAFRKRRRGQPAEDLTPAEQVERHQQLRGVRRDLEELMVEVEQLAKRFAGQMDARAAKLETLLREADQRIAELRRLQGGTADAAAKPNAAARAEDVAAAGPAPLEAPADPLARAVYRLCDEGLAPPDIARKLNEHVGKVELILALRQAG